MSKTLWGWLINKITLAIKKQIQHYALKSALAKKRGNKAFVSFDGAKTIGILYTADDTKMKTRAHRLVETLHEHKKDVQSFGFINAKKFEENLHIRYGYEYFNRSHLNWVGLPTHSHVNIFADKKFDYLINLDTESTLLSIISAQSKASCKISPSDTLFADAYDFMVSAQKGDFIKELLHYLQKIG